jgi:hypothetical protein
VTEENLLYSELGRRFQDFVNVVREQTLKVVVRALQPIANGLLRNVYRLSQASKAAAAAAHILQQVVNAIALVHSATSTARIGGSRPKRQVQEEVRKTYGIVASE